MSCIIGHANPNTGCCYPGQSVIGFETGYSRDTIKRAITWWTDREFLKTESRGIGKALAYHPQWHLFELHWIAISKNIEAEKISHAASRGDTRAALPSAALKELACCLTHATRDRKSNLSNRVSPTPIAR